MSDNENAEKDKAAQPHYVMGMPQYVFFGLQALGTTVLAFFVILFFVPELFEDTPIFMPLFGLLFVAEVAVVLFLRRNHFKALAMQEVQNDAPPAVQRRQR